MVALALAYWTRFPVPELSTSRAMRLPIGDSLADDPGLYWLVPLIPLDATHAVWLLSLAAFAVALYLQRGLPALALAVMAPVFIGAGTPYWISAWAIWMALPAGPRMAGAVAVLVTPFRAAAGLPALAWAFRSWRVGLVSLAAFLAVSSLGSHVLWHSIYIGLGWFPNPWGLVYLDASGMAATTLPYASPEYEAFLRGEVFRLIAAEPAWFVAQLAGKLGAALSLAMPWVLLFPLAVIRRPALALPFAAALAPLLLTVPAPTYATGLVAVCLFAASGFPHYGAAMTLGFSALRVCQAAPIDRGKRSPRPAT